MLSNLRNDIEIERDSLERESVELLETVKIQARKTTAELVKANNEPFRELIMNQSDIQQARQGLGNEVRQFEQNQKELGNTISVLHKALLKFGDLETYFESAEERLERIVRRLENLNVRNEDT
eukprot:g5752.t1